MRAPIWLGAAGLVAAGLALTATASAAAPGPPEEEDFSEVGLGNGVSIGLGLLRLGGDDDAPLPLRGSVIVRATTATRLIVDEATGATFGYRIDAAPLTAATAVRLVLRVAILPLASNAESDLHRLHICADCPALRLVASSVHYPPPQIVRAGETIVIDLLERPRTSEKIVDVVKISTATVTPEELAQVRDRLRKASGHVRRGDALAASGQVEDAAAEYTKAAALQPDAGIHRRLGECHERRGRTDDAIREYETALRLSAADADARLLLSVLRHRRGDFGRAADGYRQTLKVRPDWALARRNLATSHLDRGDVPRALEEYRRAYRMDPAILDTRDPSSVEARDAALQAYAIAKVYATGGDLRAALAWIERAVAAGFGDLERLKADPDFAPLRQDPRFVGLVARSARS